MDRKVVGMSNYLSIYPSICLSICFVCLSAYLSIVSFSIHVSIIIYLSTYPSSCLTTYPLSVYLPIHLSVFPSICLALYLSTQPSINQTACLVYLSFFLSIFLFWDLSISLSICLSFHLSFGLSRSSSNVPRLPSFWEMLDNPRLFLTFDQVHNPLRRPPGHAKRHLSVQKCSVPVSFCTFDLEMCFAPQQRALFQHLNFQKCSDPGVFCIFWFGNVLRATTGCTFSTSQLPKVLQPWCVLYILTWTCASRHNGVHFFDIATSKSGPTMVCFVHFDLEMCFAPQLRAIFHLSAGQMAPHPPLQRAYFSTLRSHISLEKHSEWRLSYLFAHLRLLSSDSFSSLTFSLLWLFPSLLFICPYCRKFDF